ncbi:hypothetical protein SUGI_0533710 [Cryptomeria japonica]|uniref:uncharacterized protein LOC131037271 n=1 Tax=Cryptomeria japonica TaxID=3369 RepID=UPI002408C5F3|nr:uncharacterized protein LOC131037271 [Cryptomeria japonica]GLJ27223.1 hypothetical protein SUGI_0533710 [Cryptomeria japonica]
MDLRRGEPVEVCSDEEGFKGAWYPATVIRKSGLGFLIEFKDLVTDDEKSKLREKFEADQIRPVPPSLNRQYFVAHEKVDAYDKDGWWTGTVENVLADNKYIVHFSHSGEKLEYSVYQLRLHLDWIDGKWLQPSEPSENTVNSSPKPDRRNTRPNKFKREAIFCGLSANGKADGLCTFLKNTENELTEKSRKRRRTSSDKMDDALPGRGTMNTAGRDVDGAKSVRPYKEGGKTHFSAPHANISKETEVPFSEAKNGEVQNILHARGVTGEAHGSLDSHFTPEKNIAMHFPYLADIGKTNGHPGSACETGAKATLKQLELIAYHTVLKALYLQGAHSWKIEVLLADLREVLNVSNEESACELRRITYSQNN